MGQRVADLLARHAVVEGARVLIVEQRLQTHRPDGGERHQAAVARREFGMQPEVAEQQVVRIVRERRRHHADRGVEHRLAPVLHLRIGGERRPVERGDIRGRYAALGVDRRDLHHRCRRHRPAAVDRQLGDDRPQFARRQPVVERPRGMEPQVRRPVERDQGGAGQHALVARAEAGPLPDLAEKQPVGVFGEARRDGMGLGRRECPGLRLGHGPLLLSPSFARAQSCGKTAPRESAPPRAYAMPRIGLPFVHPAADGLYAGDALRFPPEREGRAHRRRMGAIRWAR